MWEVNQEKVRSVREAGEEEVYSDGHRKVSAANTGPLRIKLLEGGECTGLQRDGSGLRALVGFLEDLVWFPSPTWWHTTPRNSSSNTLLWLLWALHTCR